MTRRTTSVTPIALPSNSSGTEPRWFALQTRSKHERKVCKDLEHAGVEAFVPVVREVHRWSDRKKSLEVPLFSCYTFIRIAEADPACGRVLGTPGVLRWVGCGPQPTPIPDQEIDSIRRLLNNNIAVAVHPFVTVGRRVRVRGGCLDGVEGILTANDGHGRLVIAIGAVKQAISISVEGYAVEPI